MSGAASSPFLGSWDSVFLAGAAEAGGKGWNLARLARYGYPVPRGGALRASAYGAFLSHNGIEPPGSVDLSDPSCAERLAAIRTAIVRGELPHDARAGLERGIEEAGLAGRALAVRSSATCEDSADASFAGIHDSFLDVEGIEDVIACVKKCYASLWSERAVAYRRKMGIAGREVAQAVVIMEMAKARASGVAFSCDPLTGDREEMVIDAGPGSGEAVVSGRVEPDEYRLRSEWLSPPKVKSRRLRAGASGGSYALRDEEMERLGLLLAAAGASLGASERPQDIEWAYDGSDFAILQARPVTALSEAAPPALAGQATIWSNGNFRDALPGVMCELYWGWTEKIAGSSAFSTVTAAGYPMPAAMRRVRRFRGRPYLNLSLMQWVFFDALRIPPEKTNTFVGGHQPEIGLPEETRSPVGRLRRRLAWAGRMMRLVSAMGPEKRHAERTFEEVRAFSAALDRVDRRALTDRELADRLDGYGPFFAVLFRRVGLLNASMAPSLMLAGLLRSVFPGRETAMANAMVAGTGHIASAETGYRLVALAEAARKDPAARAFLASEPFAASSWEGALPDDSPFKSEFRAFLDEFGHRGVYEIDLANPRWREDPTYLFDCIRANLESADLAAIRKRQQEERDRVLAEIDAKASRPRRRMIRKCAGAVVRNAERRERAKSEAVRPEESMRAFCLEAGRRLADRGCLERPDDIFHLSWFEMMAVLRGVRDGRGLAALVEDRKKERAEWLAMEAPDIVMGDTPGSTEKAIDASAGELAGLGVAAGSASGTARVLLHPDEGARLAPGDILVAPSTDPGWTPLFLRAKGIVMETGGAISHGAIVAREYGIPAVVNVPGITRIVRDGQPIVVDGDRGRVYVGERQ